MQRLDKVRVGGRVPGTGGTGRGRRTMGATMADDNAVIRDAPHSIDVRRAVLARPLAALDPAGRDVPICVGGD